MKKVIIGVFIFICMFFSIDKVLAGRGCCSHHGGQAYCSGGAASDGSCRFEKTEISTETIEY